MKRRFVTVLTIFALLLDASGLAMARGVSMNSSDVAPTLAAEQAHCADPASPYSEPARDCCAAGGCDCVLHALPPLGLHAATASGPIAGPRVCDSASPGPVPIDDPLRPPIH